MITLSIINESTVITDSEVQAYCSEQQMQVTRDFYPVWGVYAKIVFIHKGQNAPKGTWPVILLDNSDQANALGYHDIALSALDTPVAKVFVKTTIDNRGFWSVTASHEVLEMLVDPWINLVAFDGTSKFYSYEICDAVEADRLAYTIGTHKFSDFVTPAWFEPKRNPPQAMSFRKNLTLPFSLARGGYISFIDMSNPSLGWQQVTASMDEKPVVARSNTYSRRLEQRKIELEIGLEETKG